MAKKKNNTGAFHGNISILTAPMIDYNTATDYGKSAIAPSQARLKGLLAKLSLLGTELMGHILQSVKLPYLDYVKYWTGSDSWCDALRNVDVTSTPLFDKLVNTLNARFIYEYKTGLLPSDLKSKATKSKMDFLCECYSRFLPIMDSLWQAYNTVHIVANIDYLAKMDITKPIDVSDMAKLDEISIDMMYADGSYSNLGLMLSRFDGRYAIVDNFDMNNPYAASQNMLNASSISSISVLSNNTFGNVKDLKYYQAYSFTWYKSEFAPGALSWILLEGLPDRVFIPCDGMSNVEIPYSRRVTLVFTDGLVTSTTNCIVVRLNRLDPNTPVGKITIAMQLAVECSHQYYTKIAKERMYRERNQQRKQGTTPEALPTTPRNRFASLIRYYYYGDAPVTSNSTGTPHGTHASPHKHTRREHVRHYKSGKTAVIKQTVVNPNKEDTVYRMNNPHK